jgi:hypothetical protein
MRWFRHPTGLALAAGFLLAAAARADEPAGLEAAQKRAAADGRPLLVRFSSET